MTIKRIIPALVVAAGLLAVAGPVFAQDHDLPEPPAQKWSFAGPLGKFDRGQLQRGQRDHLEEDGGRLAHGPPSNHAAGNRHR